MTVIRFFNTEGDETFSVDVKPTGEMVGSNEDAQMFADDWRNSGSSPKEFVEHFSDWGNGYSSSKSDQ